MLNKVTLLIALLLPPLSYAQGLSDSYQKQKNEKNREEQAFSTFYHKTERFSCANGQILIAHFNNRVWRSTLEFAHQKLVTKMMDDLGFDTTTTQNGFAWIERNGESYSGDPKANNPSLAKTHLAFEMDRKNLFLYSRYSESQEVQKSNCQRIKY